MYRGLIYAGVSKRLTVTLGAKTGCQYRRLGTFLVAPTLRAERTPRDTELHRHTATELLAPHSQAQTSVWLASGVH